MDSLASKTTCKAVRKALRTLPSSLDQTYQKAMTRIGAQIEDDTDLAYRVLSWLSYANRPMTVEELRHALAVETNDSALDLENLPDEDILVSVCAGLVTVDQLSRIIRLVHYTAQEFFERSRMERFPDGQTDIATTCLTYLSFDSFTRPCENDQEMSSRLLEMPLLTYAARYWGDHVRQGSEVKNLDLILAYLVQGLRMACSIQALNLPAYHFAGYSQRFPRDVSGFWLAASFGLSETVKTMLSQGSDIVETDSTFGWTALHRASKNGHQEVVRLLLDKGAQIDVKDSAFERTALYQAAEYGHLIVAQLLLERGADVNARDRASTTALHASATNGLDDIVRLLLSKGADGKAMDKAERTPLHCAANNGHTIVVSILTDFNATSATVDLKNKTGWTPLAMAAGNGHLSTVTVLLQRGADVSAKDKDGATPLHHSAWNGHKHVAATLTESGADIESQDQDGWSALQYAAWRGHESMVVELLKKGAEISATSIDGWTALHRATWNGHAGVARLLLERGAESNNKDFNGETMLQQAAWRGYKALVELLLGSNADVNAKSKNGETALHWAASNGHNEIIILLIKHGADISARDNCNETALDKANEHKEKATAELLLRLEATKELPVESKQPLTPLSRGTSPPSASQVPEETSTLEGKSPIHFTANEEVGGESLDSAVLASLSLESTTTTVRPYGPPGFSKKARISSVVEGVQKLYYMKKLLDSDAEDIFEGK